MDKTAEPTTAPKDAPKDALKDALKDVLENQANPEKPRDFSAVGTALKIAAFPAAAGVGYWVMDSAARGHIIEVEQKSSKVLQNKHEAYLRERARLSQAVDSGLMDSAVALAEREKNHAQWREALYENLNKKGFYNLRTKFEHLRRVDKQQVIIEGITVMGIMLGAAFAIINSSFFQKRQDKDTPSL